MEKLMQLIANLTVGKSYNTEKYSYDAIGTPAFDYDSEEPKIMNLHTNGETEKHKETVPLRDKLEKVAERPLIKFFLDGSRHVYKVDDISYNKRVYPVLAGQVGVGCCSRVNGRMRPEKFYRRLVLALPKVSNSGGWSDEGVFGAWTSKLNESPLLKRLNLKFSTILPYSMPKNGQKDKVEDSGIACIQDYMIESEKEMVAELVKEKRFDQEYLLKDGSLEYKPVRRGRVDFRELRKIKNNYRWVIGVSKSFNPESVLDNTGKPNGNYLADLPLYHRTPVALYENEFLGDVQFAVWYVRIRDKSRTRTPFDGVLKVEKILMDNEMNSGIESETIDILSANLINERMPTCYGTDRRWANHLYPVFLTESFVKSQYISAELFLNLF